MDSLNIMNSSDWDLGMIGQPSGLFGDLYEFSHLYTGDMNPAFKPRDAVQLSNSSPESQESIDFEWMESGDLNTLLAAFEESQQELVSSENALLDCSQTTTLPLSCKEEPVNFDYGYLNQVGQPFDLVSQGLTPPDSPEQVSPVIQFGASSLPSDYVASNSLLQELCDTSPAADIQVDYLLDPVDSIFDLQLVNSVDDFNGVDVSTVLSPDELSSSSSSSVVVSPAPSPRPSIDSLIQSSPELYKVIATPSSVAARFSPYSKSKGEHKSKTGSTNASNSNSKTKELLLSDDSCSSSELANEDLYCGLVGKRERKKMQNKNAAIRYRQKKKAEAAVVVNEVTGLEDRNKELKVKVDDLQREIKYMKNLMDDIYRAKGLIK